MPLNQISVDLESNIRLWGQVCLKLYERQNFENINIKIVTSMQKCTRVQNSVNLENLGFWDQIYPKNMNDTNFEKINIKFETRI